MVLSLINKVIRNKWVWIGLGLIVVIIILRRVLPDMDIIRSRYGRKHGDWQPGQEGSLFDHSGGISDRRKGELETLAENMHKNIYSTFGNARPVITKLLVLNDNELNYLAKYYKKELTRKNSLALDIDDEILWDTDKDEELLQRLYKLGLA